LDKAEKLIGQLSGEQQRWKVQTGQLRTDLEKLPMKMYLIVELLSQACFLFFKLVFFF
jgi:hypothetical protein